MTDAPLQLPSAPFNLDHAQTGARLVADAYRVHRQWDDQDKPEPDAFVWTEPEQPGFAFGKPLWGHAGAHPLLRREQPYGFVARRGSELYVVFRGTENAQDVLIDLALDHVAYAVPGCEGFGQVHEGFMNLYASLREAMLAQLESLEGVEQIIVAGHSMGACLSTLAVPDLVTNAKLDLGRVGLTHYAFGSPRVGDITFGAHYHAIPAAHDWTNARTYRISNSEDVVINLPPPVIDRLIRDDVCYQHVGTTVGFGVNHGSTGDNHAHGRTYLYAIEHPDAPRPVDGDT